MIEGILITIIGGLFLFFFAAYFKHRSEISELKAANLQITNKRANQNTQSKPSDKKEIAKLNKEIAKLGKQLADNEAKYEKTISDLQATVAIYESNDTILAKYPLDKRLGLRIDVDGNILCINCVHETPPKEVKMIPRTTGWLCQVCGKSQSDPRKVERFNHSGPKRPDGLAGR